MQLDFSSKHDIYMLDNNKSLKSIQIYTKYNAMVIQ